MINFCKMLLFLIILLVIHFKKLVTSWKRITDVVGLIFLSILASQIQVGLSSLILCLQNVLKYPYQFLIYVSKLPPLLMLILQI